MKAPFLRTPYNYDMNAASDQAGLVCPPGEGVTQQQFRDEVDINTIVRNFGITGEMPENLKMPVSGDFTGISDYHQALNLVLQAEDGFMTLPGDMRARFQNDPGQLLAFLENPANKDEAIKLGLVNKPAEPIRTAVDAIDELAGKLAPKSGAS